MLLRIHTHIQKKHLHTSSLNIILKHFEIYLKVLCVCLGEVENTHLMKLNQFIAPMDAQPHEKKHLHTLTLWHIILKHLSIKALTLDIPWHILDKNYIDLWLLWMYILMQKNNLVTKLLLSYRIFKNIGLWLVNTKMDMAYHEQAETLNHTIMSSHTIMSRSMFNIA